MREKPKITQTHGRILNIIKEHKGKLNAITYKAIAHMIGIHERVVRKYVSDLIFIHREPIGSSYDQMVGGYYWITTKEEAEENWRVMRQHGVRIIRRGADAYNIPHAELMGQLEIDLAPLEDGHPCGHPGCLSHVSHPCEGCGRIGGRTLNPGDLRPEA